MATEIERTFMVDERVFPVPRDVWEDDLGVGFRPSGVPIIQGYLSDDPVTRVRYTPFDAWITVKGPGLVERAEFEYAIPSGDAVTLVNKLARWGIVKTRFKVEHAGHTWEVDRFGRYLKGLWLAEIELPRRQERFELPDWLGPEVTNDPAFANINLAKRMCPPDRWRQWVATR